jgi:deoxyribodipyrimidine photo-lyase
MPMTLFDAPEPLTNAVTWTPTRAAGLARLDAFLPWAGRTYTRDRNIDRGPDDRSNVSALSPWIRRRLVTEEEVIAAVLKRHSFASAEKFIQEVYWRSYWKGWLEMRPGLLRRFDADRRALAKTWAGDQRLKAAMDGRTGVACFDAWVEELRSLGWLHNHARMWFASIWIFTLRLPWQLGADFFYKYLLDADPASNTLSWRWVAGLHTTGKHYLARAANIRDNTLGRFDPSGALDEGAKPLTEDDPPPMPQALGEGDYVRERKTALLITAEDLCAETWVLKAEVTACAALNAPEAAAPETPSAAFLCGALTDGLGRAIDHFSAPGESLRLAEVAAWAKKSGAKELVTSYAPVGLTAWALDRLGPDLAAEGIRLVRLQRPFDRRVWPHARAGFFKLKEKIPQLLAGVPGPSSFGSSAI